ALAWVVLYADGERAQTLLEEREILCGELRNTGAEIAEVLMPLAEGDLVAGCVDLLQEELLGARGGKFPADLPHEVFRLCRRHAGLGKDLARVFHDAFSIA